MDFLIPEWSDTPAGIGARVGAISTLRTGGVSAAPYDDGRGGGGLNLGIHVGDNPADVQTNRERLQALLPGRPAWLTQVHGVRVADAADVADAPEADACIATRPGMVCAILTADCLPVLLCDQAGKVVGAAHAGWRGLAGGVLEETLVRMRQAGAGEIQAWLGPAIGPDRFEVGEDVLQEFAGRDEANRRFFQPVPGRPGKYMADIYGLARAALAKAGVGKVTGGGFCTVTDERRFYSYRRDGVTGRMASLIWIK